MTLIYILIALALVVGAYVIFTYNRLIKLKNMVEEGWSGIDVQLKRRANLVPNLVETVKGYATHEKSTLEEVVELRNRSLAADKVDEQGRVEGLLQQALGRLFALAEAYPELKADANFRALQDDLGELETEIQSARRYYNGAVRNLNVLVQSFPSNLVAKGFGFVEATFFEIEDAAERAVPEVTFSA